MACWPALAAAILTNIPAAAADGGRHLALQVSGIPGASASEGVELEESSNQISVGLHRFGNDEAWLGVGLEYQYTRYEYEGLDSRNRDLHRFQVPVRWQWTADTWTYGGVVAPGLATSSNVIKDPFNLVTADDVVVTARVHARRPLGGGTFYLGAAWDRLFGRPALYPFGGVEYAAGDRWHLRVGLPDPSVSFRASQRHTLSARLYPAGNQWHVLSDDWRNDFLYRAEGYRSRLTWSVNAFSSVTIDVFAGLEFGRHHRLETSTGNDRRLDVDSQWLFGVGVRSASAPMVFVHDY